MASLVHKMSKLAMQTFSQPKDKNFQENLAKLSDLMKQVRPNDVNFDPQQWFKHKDYVPDHDMDFISLDFVSGVYNMGIFILYKGTKIRLHDHPNMYGLIKVIHGNIHVESFSHFPDNKIVEANKSEEIPLEYKVRKRQTMDVTAGENKILKITPIDNFHEITAAGGGAAFMDILSPPYDQDRYCHFYKIKQMNSDGEGVLRQNTLQFQN